MRPPRVRFTVRRLMVVVALAAVAMGACNRVRRRWEANGAQAAGHRRAADEAMRRYWIAYAEASQCLAQARSARSRQRPPEEDAAAARGDPGKARDLRAAGGPARAEAEGWDRAGEAPLRAVEELSRAAQEHSRRAEDCRRRWW